MVTGVVILIIFLVLGLFVFVPFMIFRAMNQAKIARNFVPDLLRKTGLNQDGNHLSGKFRGFEVDVYFGLGFNYGNLILSGKSGWDMVSELEGRSTFYQTLHVQMKVPGANFPPIMIKEHVGLLRTDQWLMDKFEGRNVELEEIDGIKIRRSRFYGTDRQLAQRLASDPELIALVSNWHYTDIRAQGDVVELVLNDNMVMPTFGSRRMSRPDFVVEALNMCARLGELGK